MEVLPCSSMGQFVESGALQTKSLMEVNHDTPTNYGLRVNGQTVPYNGEGDPELETDEACRVFKYSHVTVNIIDCDNNNDQSSVSGSMAYQEDESIALWAKWKGIWQAGIKCKRADWPLDVVKAKPNPNRKKNYVVMFFPHARNYSWVNTLLVLPINELPDSIVHASHEVGIQLVQDLAVAQRFIMQKLTVGILDIVDRLNFQALVEDSANINALKEFAMEAPRCKGYPDLGRMLMKLQKMFLEQYIDCSWLQCSFASWVSRCQTAPSAESIENLREELVSSILWKEINALQDTQWLEEQGSEWKMWKQEVVKLFSSSNLILCVQRPEQTINTIIEHQGIGSPFLAGSQGIRKRPKLEVRRAEPQTPQVENSGNCDSDPNIDSVPSRDFERKEASGIKSSRCKAFIEAKGRQCVRWASEGDEYCCVHQLSRDNSKAVVPFQPAVELPICGGTTILGTRCKHHALPGSTFCKKHGPKDGKKRKRVEQVSSPRSLMELRDEAEKPLEVEPLSVRSAAHDLGRTDATYCIVGRGCLASPKRHLMYCEEHVPNFLKRARNGKSRIITKEVFLDLLKDCSSRDMRIRFHVACELFFKVFKSILSPRNTVPMETHFKWAMDEASKDEHVAKYFMKLVVSEKERIQRIWGLGNNENPRPSIAPEQPSATQEEPADDWIGYACSICLDSFRNRKVLETHVQDRHHAVFSEHCMLFQCIRCSVNFGNSEELRSHVRSSHEGEDCRQSNGPLNPAGVQNPTENSGAIRKYLCKFCPSKFVLLPDLGRHHQAVHMEHGEPSSNPTAKKAYRLKSGRLTRPNFKRALEEAPNGQINKVSMGLKKPPQTSNAHADAKKLLDPECLDVAKALHSMAKTAISRPSDHDILKAARVACCKVSLKALLHEKYTVLTEKLHLRAAKLCSEHGIRIFWHVEGFVCPNGCGVSKDPNAPPTLTLVPRENMVSRVVPRLDDFARQWEKDEQHCVISPDNLGLNCSQTTIILCNDISFGKESVPIRCIIDKPMLGSLHVPNVGVDGQTTYLPWETFSYITKPLLHPSLDVDTQTQGSYMACGCSGSACSAETCDHVYLFNTDFEDAKDMNGKPMIGRFPYDGTGQLALEDNFAIYECNGFCRCTKNCPNRVLQKGIQVKLEVFRTLKKGWALRATEPISCGKFVCEFIGEVLNEQEASKRRERYGLENCGFLYDLGSSIYKLSQLEEQIPCFIDTTKNGNVSHFINHSCAPNLVARVVIVESMDYRLARIGLYTNRDIAAGEELTRDYGSGSQPGSCYCRSSSCRGRVI